MSEVKRILSVTSDLAASPSLQKRPLSTAAAAASLKAKSTRGRERSNHRPTDGRTDHCDKWRISIIAQTAERARADEQTTQHNTAAERRPKTEDRDGKEGRKGGRWETDR